MKKLLLIISLVFAYSCSTDGGDDINSGTQDSEACTKIKAAVENAKQAYLSSPQSGTEANCKLYLNALKDQILVCGDPNGEVQKIIDSLKDCTDDL